MITTRDFTYKTVNKLHKFINQDFISLSSLESFKSRLDVLTNENKNKPAGDDQHNELLELEAISERVKLLDAEKDNASLVHVNNYVNPDKNIKMDLSKLNADILKFILTYLPYRDQTNMAHVSKLMSQYIDETKIKEEFVFFKDMFAAKTNRDDHKTFKKFLREHGENINVIIKNYKDFLDVEFNQELSNKLLSENFQMQYTNDNKFVLSANNIAVTSAIPMVLYITAAIIYKIVDPGKNSANWLAYIALQIVIALILGGVIGAIAFLIEKTRLECLRSQNKNIIENRFKFFGTENPENPNNLLTDIKVEPIDDEENQLMEDYKKPAFGSINS